MPVCSENGVGFTKRCMCAYSQPDAHASIAASTKTIMRDDAVFTPIDSAITMPPLSARMARPSRESSRLQRGEDAGHQEEPDQVVDLAARFQRDAEDLDRRERR